MPSPPGYAHRVPKALSIRFARQKRRGLSPPQLITGITSAGFLTVSQEQSTAARGFDFFRYVTPDISEDDVRTMREVFDALDTSQDGHVAIPSCFL